VKLNPRLQKSLVGNEELELTAPIGKGSFGEVYRGKWRGVEVAIKRMLIDDMETVTSFMKEASLMSTLRHPNIVQFLGASIKPPHLNLITELCTRGSLHDVLRTFKVAVPKKRKKQMLVDAALGMLYLHSENIIHRYVQMVLGNDLVLS
jgi:serine/threonine protein kinase